jgi:hypothetical protein
MDSDGGQGTGLPPMTASYVIHFTNKSPMLTMKKSSGIRLVL